MLEHGDKRKCDIDQAKKSLEKVKAKLDQNYSQLDSVVQKWVLKHKDEKTALKNSKEVTLRNFK